MIILSLMQKNVIAGLTIGTMAVIVLAIRIWFLIIKWETLTLLW
jgi:hypothetical protein